MEDIYAQLIYLEAQVIATQHVIFGYLATLRDKSISEKSALGYSQTISKYLVLGCNRSPYDPQKMGELVKALVNQRGEDLLRPDEQ